MPLHPHPFYLHLYAHISLQTTSHKKAINDPNGHSMNAVHTFMQRTVETSPITRCHTLCKCADFVRYSILIKTCKSCANVDADRH